MLSIKIPDEVFDTNVALFVVAPCPEVLRNWPSPLITFTPFTPSVVNILGELKFVNGTLGVRSSPTLIKLYY